MHRKCRTEAFKANRRQVRCLTCPNTAWLSQKRINRLNWSEERSGVLYRYCGNCSRRQRADVVRLFSGTLAKHGKGTFNRGKLLEAWKATIGCEICADLRRAADGLLDTEGKAVRVALRRAVEIDSESSLKALETRPTLAHRVRTLVEVCRQRRSKALDDWRTRNPKLLVAHQEHELAVLDLRKRLRGRLAAIAPKGHRIGQKAWNKATSRPNLATAKVVAADLRPLFGRCALPGCPFILYRVATSRPGPNTTFHPQCWRLFKKDKHYRRWRGKRVQGIEAALSFPAAPARPGRPALADDPDLLLSAYRWVIAAAAPRSVGGTSQRSIAREHGISHQGVTKRVQDFIELLPGSWDSVFQGKGYRSSNRTRQKLVPLPAYRTDRSEVARRFVSIGMPLGDVATLTGVPEALIRQLSPTGNKIA